MCLTCISRTSFICAAANEEAEKLFLKTVEVDRLIDMLMESNAKQVCLIIFSFSFFQGIQINLQKISNITVAKMYLKF